MECLRCTEEVVAYVVIAPYLCIECFNVIGPRPSASYTVCECCGDRWHQTTLPMCQSCFVEEGEPRELTH